MPITRSAGLALAALLAAAAGCSAAPAAAGPALPVGSSARSISVGGLIRTFRVYRPAALPASAPLVVMLHGAFGDGAQAERDYHWDAEADRAGFVVAYPDGLNRAWAVGGGCCGRPGASQVDDVGFVSRLVAAIEGAAPIDPNRVYAAGISNGGMLAYRLACDTSIFAAIGPDSATLLGACPAPAPISVIHVHGTADTNIPYAGGPGGGVARIDGPSVPDLNATWRRIDGCAAPTVTTAGAVTISAADCPGGRAVELVTIAGAGHQWPGAVPNELAQRVLGAAPPSTALDATDVMWRFFAARHR